MEPRYGGAGEVGRDGGGVPGLSSSIPRATAAPHMNMFPCFAFCAPQCCPTYVSTHPGLLMLGRRLPCRIYTHTHSSMAVYTYTLFSTYRLNIPSTPPHKLAYPPTNTDWHVPSTHIYTDVHICIYISIHILAGMSYLHMYTHRLVCIIYTHTQNGMSHLHT